MAPSCEKQPDLFQTLDGEVPAEVFYFPHEDATQADQLSAIERTLTHLSTLQGIFEKHKAAVASAPKYAGVVRFVWKFESLLREQKEKLLAVNESVSKSTPESTPAVTGHAR